MMYWFARAAPAKNHTLGGLNNRNELSHGSAAWAVGRCVSSEG